MVVFMCEMAFKGWYQVDGSNAIHIIIFLHFVGEKLSITINNKRSSFCHFYSRPKVIRKHTTMDRIYCLFDLTILHAILFVKHYKFVLQLFITPVYSDEIFQKICTWLFLKNKFELRVSPKHPLPIVVGK